MATLAAVLENEGTWQETTLEGSFVGRDILLAPVHKRMKGLGLADKFVNEAFFGGLDEATQKQILFFDCLYVSF